MDVGRRSRVPGRGLDYWTGPLCFFFRRLHNTKRLDFSSDRAAVEQQTKKDVMTMSASLEWSHPAGDNGTAQISCADNLYAKSSESLSLLDQSRYYSLGRSVHHWQGIGQFTYHGDSLCSGVCSDPRTKITSFLRRCNAVESQKNHG